VGLNHCPQTVLKTLALLLALIVRKGLYPATDKNTAMESLWVGDGIDFICTPLQVGQPVIAVFCELDCGKGCIG
jgi:hypothetical protein